MNDYQQQFDAITEQSTQTHFDIDELQSKIKLLNIETPSWAYGDSGTRFGIFPQEGAAQNVYQKIDDAAYVHALTGAAPSIALHIPWDEVEDWSAVIEYAQNRNIRIGSINPNLFQDSDYKLGSLCHPQSQIRDKAIAHVIDCCHIMKETGSNILSLWMADGTNYTGQDSMSERKHRLQDALAQIYTHLPHDSQLLIEYKFFEPAFYHTDLADWGMAYAFALKIGERAKVLVDTGHHAQGTNIAHIVSFLLDENRLGGFHFNARRYADDDLIVGTNNPLELFEIFVELVMGNAITDDVAYMIDQSHNIEPKVEAMIFSILNCQIAYTKALLVDFDQLRKHQISGDVLSAHSVLMDAYHTDVRPLLAEYRSQNNLPVDPLLAHRQSDYLKRVALQRQS